MNNWYGQYPSHWKLERLQNYLIEINESNNPIKSDNILSLTNKLGVVPYNEKGNQGNVAKENLEGYKLAYSNTIVCNCMNVLIGSVGISKYFGCVSPVYYVYKAKENADLDFINYVFQTVPFQKELRRYANGILEIRLRVSSSNILKREIPIPSKEEQIKIVKAIKDIEDKNNALIANEEKQIEKLKAYKQVLISEVVTKGLDPNVPMKDSGIDWIDEIPQNWSVIRFKYVAKLENGKEVTSTNGNIPVYGSGGIFKYTDSYLYDGPSLLTGRKGTIDNPMLVNGKFWTVDTMFYTSKIMNIDYKFLYYAYLGCTNFHFYKTGSVLPSMTQANIKNNFLTYTKNKVQKEISTYLDSKIKQIENLIVKKNEIVQKLKLYYQSIIYEYVTGKRKVY